MVKSFFAIIVLVISSLSFAEDFEQNVCRIYDSGNAFVGQIYKDSGRVFVQSWVEFYRGKARLYGQNAHLYTDVRSNDSDVKFKYSRIAGTQSWFVTCHLAKAAQTYVVSGPFCGSLFENKSLAAWEGFAGEIFLLMLNRKDISYGSLSFPNVIN